MYKKDIRKIEEHLKDILTEDRYTHTLGVAYTSASMAMAYQGDMEQSYVAGLLHDCAKCISDEEKIRICDKNNIYLSDLERKNPYLIHSKLGSYLAQMEYGISDQEILSAIQYHTTGKPDMSLLEKIVFTADYIEPSRRKAPNLFEIRAKAFENIEKAMVIILRDTLKHLQDTSLEIDDLTMQTYQYYLKKTGEL
ncbi:MAG: bis(5'-nucleosyl)-tetraphosphatase (symmetrical) YqeK [Lachnospiraceae bacterium]|nr:bis(5'-nucleosyl)-tetraphosphatase (symmetrical) YqeK [Lachnospiraceae bacterium]